MAFSKIELNVFLFSQ